MTAVVAGVGLLPIVGLAVAGIGAGLIFDSLINSKRDFLGSKSEKQLIKDGLIYVAHEAYDSFMSFFGG